MSLTPLSPIISDWIALGLEWKYIWQPRYGPKTIPAKGQIQLPRDDFIYTYPEGVLLTLVGGFDSPNCGIKMVTPQLDMGDLFTPANSMISGASNQPFFAFSSVPPYTPHGTFIISLYSTWAWRDTCEIYLINTDTVDHTAFGFAYSMAVLVKPRRVDALLSIERAKLAIELDPSLKAELRKKITSAKLTEWMKVE